MAEKQERIRRMEEKKMNGKKLQGVETKKKIFKTAAELFSEYGFDKVSVDSIIAKAGISKGGFYVHFDSKDALTAALIDEYVSRLDLSYLAYVKSFPEDTEASEVLQSLVGRIADMITDEIGYNLIRIAYRIQIDRKIPNGTLLSSNRDLNTVFSDLLRRGVRQGEFREDLDVKAVAEQFVTVSRGFTYEWCIRYPEYRLKGELLRHFDLLLFGIKK